MKTARFPLLPLLSLLVALACLGGLTGCRRVTVISFRTSVDTAPPIDGLVVNLYDAKDSLPLKSMDKQIGLYDLTGDTIRITVWACFHDNIVLSNDDHPQPYEIVGDMVLVTLSSYGGDPMIHCPQIVDGGVSGEPGGSSGTNGAGGMGGEGGINGAGGMGGETIGAGGSIDAGAGGAGGDLGVGGNGCGGTGAGGTIGTGTCDAPTGAPDVPTVTMFNQACTGYCNDMATACPTTYSDVTECQRYCTLAGWATGSGSTDRGDTISCRDAYASMAAIMPEGQRASKCAVAGASGGTVLDCGASAGLCAKFCSAFAGVCARDKQACMNACATLPAASVTCRFPWLQSASDDTRYCPLIDLTVAITSCRPTGC